MPGVDQARKAPTEALEINQKATYATLIRHLAQPAPRRLDAFTDYFMQLRAIYAPYTIPVVDGAPSTPQETQQRISEVISTRSEDKVYAGELSTLLELDRKIFQAESALYAGQLEGMNETQKRQALYETFIIPSLEEAEKTADTKRALGL